MNNDLFADDAPMVEGSVEPSHPTSDAGSNFGQQNDFGKFGGQNEFTSPKNDFSAPQNDFASSKNDFASSKNDFVIPQQNEFVDPQPGVAATSPLDQQNNSQGSQPRTFGSPHQQQQQQASPVNDDGFFAPAPAAAPAAASSPIIPSNGSQRNLATSGPTSAAASVTSPGATMATSGSAAPPAAVNKAAAEKGKAKLEAQRRAVIDRVAAADAATKQKEQEIQKKAADFLAEAIKKRNTAMATVKADHLKEQQQHEAKLSQFKKSGAVWNSVNLLIDTTKPNPYSKSTEHMRVLIGELKQE